MPNHIINVLVVEGDEKQIADCMQSICSEAIDGRDATPIDFQKVIPRPSELDISADGLVSYLDNKFMVSIPVSSFIEALMKAPDSVIENFCHALRNKRKFGASTWYEWSIENWGTKWNAFSTSQHGNAITFDTAWSMPDPIFRALSARYPELTFKVDYADEDIGSNCGTCIYKAGQLVEDRASRAAHIRAERQRPNR